MFFPTTHSLLLTAEQILFSAEFRMTYRSNQMKKPLKIIVIITFAVYVMMIISVTFLGERHALHNVSIIEHFINRSNLIPFRTVSNYIRAIKNNIINYYIPIKNIVGNLLLFLPMSVFLACMIKKCRSLPINLLVISL